MQDIKIYFEKKKNIIIIILVAILAISITTNIILVNLVQRYYDTPSSFLRFKSAQYGYSLMKYDSTRKHSIPLEAILIKRTGRKDKGVNYMFIQNQKKIDEYLADSSNIINLRIAESVQDEEQFLLGLYFDYPGVLYVNATTNEGIQIPVENKNHMFFLNFKEFYYNNKKNNTPIVVSVIANEFYYTNEFLFQLDFN